LPYTYVYKIKPIFFCFLSIDVQTTRQLTLKSNVYAFFNAVKKGYWRWWCSRLHIRMPM